MLGLLPPRAIAPGSDSRAHDIIASWLISSVPSEPIGMPRTIISLTQEDKEWLAERAPAE